MVNADVFIGVSIANVVTQDMVRSMNEKSIVLPMANPVPEIMPHLAHEAGAYVVGTGRSDFPNQVNNVLAFPGIFRGALDAKATHFNHDMKIAAAFALAESVENLTRDNILPSVLDKRVPYIVAEKVKQIYLNSVLNECNA